MKNKYKIVIKGNKEEYRVKVKMNCDSGYPMEGLTNLLMQMAIDFEYDEKEFFKILKQTYKELKNESEEK